MFIWFCDRQLLFHPLEFKEQRCGLHRCAMGELVFLKGLSLTLPISTHALKSHAEGQLCYEVSHYFKAHVTQQYPLKV